MTWCFAKNLCTRHDACTGVLSWRRPIAAAFWVIWIVSTEERSGITQNMRQNCCRPHPVTLNAMGTQYTCSLNRVHRPWSRHCSRMCNASRFSWASRFHWNCSNCSHYINGGWTFSNHSLYIYIYINKLAAEIIPWSYTISMIMHEFVMSYIHTMELWVCNVTKTRINTSLLYHLSINLIQWCSNLFKGSSLPVLNS